MMKTLCKLIEQINVFKAPKVVSNITDSSAPRVTSVVPQTAAANKISEMVNKEPSCVGGVRI